MDIVEQTLLDDGVDRSRIHVERFTPLDAPVPEPHTDVEAPPSEVTIELDGRTETTDHRPGHDHPADGSPARDVAAVLLRVGELRDVHRQARRGDRR